MNACNIPLSAAYAPALKKPSHAKLSAVKPNHAKPRRRKPHWKPWQWFIPFVLPLSFLLSPFSHGTTFSSVVVPCDREKQHKCAEVLSYVQHLDDNLFSQATDNIITRAQYDLALEAQVELPGFTDYFEENDDESSTTAMLALEQQLATLINRVQGIEPTQSRRNSLGQFVFSGQLSVLHPSGINICGQNPALCRDRDTHVAASARMIAAARDGVLSAIEVTLIRTLASDGADLHGRFLNAGFGTTSNYAGRLFAILNRLPPTSDPRPIMMVSSQDEADNAEIMYLNSRAMAAMNEFVSEGGFWVEFVEVEDYDSAIYPLARQLVEARLMANSGEIKCQLTDERLSITLEDLGLTNHISLTDPTTTPDCRLKSLQLISLFLDGHLQAATEEGS